jgi:hypothetical protein
MPLPLPPGRAMSPPRELFLLSPPPPPPTLARARPCRSPTAPQIWVSSGRGAAHGCAGAGRTGEERRVPCAAEARVRALPRRAVDLGFLVSRTGTWEEGGHRQLVGDGVPRHDTRLVPRRYLRLPPSSRSSDPLLGFGAINLVQNWPVPGWGCSIWWSIDLSLGFRWDY